METFEAFESVWDAIEEDPKEATKLKISSELIFQIIRIVKENNWSANEAAEHFQTTPARMDDVLAGRIYRFQLIELLDMAAGLGGRVRVEIEAA